MKPAVRWLLRAFAALGLVIAVPVGALWWISRVPQAPFDSVVWRDPKSFEYRKGEPTDRQRMIDDVIARVLRGRCEPEILKDLGPSEDTFYFRGNGRDLIYVLGPERGLFAIDHEWLLVWLDEKRCYRRYSVVTD